MNPAPSAWKRAKEREKWRQFRETSSTLEECVLLLSRNAKPSPPSSEIIAVNITDLSQIREDVCQILEFYHLVPVQYNICQEIILEFR